MVKFLGAAKKLTKSDLSLSTGRCCEIFTHVSINGNDGGMLVPRLACVLEQWTRICKVGATPLPNHVVII